MSESGQSFSPVKHPHSPILMEEESDLKSKDTKDHKDVIDIDIPSSLQSLPQKVSSNTASTLTPEVREKIPTNDNCVINQNLNKDIIKLFFMNMYDYQYEESQKLELYSQEKAKAKQTNIMVEKTGQKIKAIDKELFDQTILV